MEHQYIESGKKQLYSVYHEPKIGDNDKTGIILCYPLGQEYIRCHKLYVNLAKKLVEHGYHVLRFDYSGTGDSLGSYSSVTVKDCLEDIGIAIKELKELCGVTRVLLMGVRFGATLSIIYSQNNKVDGLILWNPITNGSDYLKEIDKSYKNWLSGSFTKEKRYKEKSLNNFGYLFSSMFVKNIKSIFIDEKYNNINIPTLLIDDSKLFLKEELNNVTFKKAKNKEFWIKGENEREKSMVPVYEVNNIVNWVNQI